MADEDRVRELAYSIWESEGRPEGQQQRHWDMALKIVAAEQAAGHEAELDELGEPIDEAPILEDDLPLEDDEIGIQENRLPLDPPDGEPDFDELPYRDDRLAGSDTPVHDRAAPGTAGSDEVPSAASTRALPVEEATGSGAQAELDANRGGADAPAGSPGPGAGPMEPLPAQSATARRARQPRREEDGLTQPDPTDTAQVPGKTAKRSTKRSAKSETSTAKPDAGTKSTKPPKSTGRSSRTKPKG